jgi:hypothetical protein
MSVVSVIFEKNGPGPPCVRRFAIPLLAAGMQGNSLVDHEGDVIAHGSDRPFIPFGPALTMG